MNRNESAMLELDDVQHILLTRTPVITGRYEFLAFDTPVGGRAWLSEYVGYDAVRRRCGRHLGWFRPLGHIGVYVDWFAGVGRAARIVGHPSRRLPRSMLVRAGIWATPATMPPNIGSAAWPATICTRSRSCSPQCRRSIESTTSCSKDRRRPQPFVLDLNATPPFNYAHDHFGFRDRLSQPVMKGSGEEPTPAGAALEPGELILGYPVRETGPWPILPDSRSVVARPADFSWHTAG